jgi:hypothetical protein
MISCRPTALIVLTMVAATCLAAGCWHRKTAKSAAPQAAAPQTAEPTRIPAWLKGPLDNVGKLLLDLDSGDPVRCWHAEEALGDLGAEVAPRTRLAMGASTPEARAAACRLAYKFRDEAAIPAMIALLADEPKAGRGYDHESRLVMNTANVFLCGLTDRDFNFRPDALPAERAAAKARWEAWYASAYGPGLAPKRK